MTGVRRFIGARNPQLRFAAYNARAYPRHPFMSLLALKSRYHAVAQRFQGSLSEVERRDVSAFDAWFYRGGGWRHLFAIVGVTTFCAWIASLLPWNMTFVEAAILFNVVVLMLIWSGLTAWFGYRKFAGRLFRVVVTGPLLALVGALIGAAVGGFIKGVDPVEWLQDSTKLRHIITAALIFGFLYTLVVALIASLRNREYAAETAHLAAERRQSELSRQLVESKLQAAAAPDRAALPVQHAGKRAAARREGRARRGAPHRRPDPLSSRVGAVDGRRGGDAPGRGGARRRVPRDHANAPRVAAHLFDRRAAGAAIADGSPRAC